MKIPTALQKIYRRLKNKEPRPSIEMKVEKCPLFHKKHIFQSLEGGPRLMHQMNTHTSLKSKNANI